MKIFFFFKLTYVKKKRAKSDAYITLEKGKNPKDVCNNGLQDIAEQVK